MAARFATALPLEQAYLRKALLAVEVIDAVTLSRVDSGLAVHADGLLGNPVLNAGGMFVWLEEPSRQPTAVRIDTRDLPYEPRIEPVPPQFPQLLSLELAPSREYPFPSGITAVRATLVEHRLETPPVPVADATVWLRWIDDAAPGTMWVDAPVRAHTNRSGDFVVFTRFTAAQVPRLDAQRRLRVRFAATRSGSALLSNEFSIALGRVTDASAENVPPHDVRRNFAWDQFLP